ncbi:MAG: hypothetical protein K2X38_15990 [Gemmataceae bacterium]|nr:hypothetical protein [Gemmataceae bacterium]
MIRMRSWIALSVLLCLTQVSSARALVVAQPPGPQKFAGMQTIAVGRVAALEDQDVEIGDGDNKQTWRIAVVQVSEGIKGAKAKQQIRVGFMIPQQPRPGVPQLSSGPYRGPQFQVGQEGLFMLQQHPQAKFQYAPIFYHFVSSQQPNFKKDVEDAKVSVHILQQPKEALSKGTAQEKLQAASLIVTSFRSPTGPNPKQEPVDAETSKLILKALRDADWNQQPGRFNQTHPMNVLFQLGLTEKDGFRPGGDTPAQTHQAAQQWLDANMNTYRIQRFVSQPPSGVLEEK